MGKKSKTKKPLAKFGEELSKAERKALKAREAELAAELARREKSGKKKSKKKNGKKADTAKAGDLFVKRNVDGSVEHAVAIPGEGIVKITATEAAVIADAKAERERKRLAAESKVGSDAMAAVDPDAKIERKKKSAKATVADAAAKTAAEAGSEGALIAAKTAAAAAAEAGDDETDEQIKARVKAKRARRAELESMWDDIDRNDHEAVRAYNEELGTLGGGKFMTSTAEVDAEVKRMHEPKPETVAKVSAAVEALKAEVTELETEHGREFMAGPTVPVGTGADEGFAKPSEAPRLDFEVNGNGQYKIKRPSDGKIVGYTRVTTYISCLEDRSRLEAWKMRMLLEGVAVNDTEPSERDEAGRDPVAAVMADLVHRRDVAIAKARKADRKGKLVHGQLATIVEGAWSEFKKASNALAEELLDLGGAHEKAQKGTDLHALTELYDREGIDAVGDLLVEGKITPADLADVEAYADALTRAGIRIVPEHIEQVIVNDELKVAGRLDRVVLAKFPGMARAVRCVLDLKTGQVELGAGKIAQQLEMYAGGQGYDLDTHERTDLKLSRTKAILVHLPAGSGECYIHPVDLGLGRKGNKLAGEVRAFRNEGKRAIDFKTDLAAPSLESVLEASIEDAEAVAS